VVVCLLDPEDKENLWKFRTHPAKKISYLKLAQESANT
jgi:hypothetical protein